MSSSVICKWVTNRIKFESIDKDSIPFLTIYLQFGKRVHLYLNKSYWFELFLNLIRNFSTHSNLMQVGKPLNDHPSGERFFSRAYNPAAAKIPACLIPPPNIFSICELFNILTRSSKHTTYWCP